MKQLGYFQRRESFFLLLGIFVLILICYALVLFKVILQKKELHFSKISIFFFFLAYFLAYPAFLSYDIFNYFFDAKILTIYHLNPYFKKALDFPYDPWVRFMRWTHRTLPYGPVWLVFTLIPVFFGFGKLVPTILLFKLVNLGVLVGISLMIKKINEMAGEKNDTSAAAFLLNPLVICDLFLSMHNEGLMIFFLLVSLYFFLRQQNFWSLVFLFLSVGVKYVSIVILPVYFLIILRRKTFSRPAKVLRFFSEAGFVLTAAALIIVIYFREAYSWYFTLPMVFLALKLTTKKAILLFVFSCLIFRYLPYILLGVNDNLNSVWTNSISNIILGGVFLIAGGAGVKRFQGITLKRIK